MAYEAPVTDWPTTIVHPQGAYTDIVRDVFGKPTVLTRRNADSSIALSRNYYYDSNQLLCRTAEPESDSTVYEYDAANNLVWSAAGHNYPLANYCYRTQAATGGRRVDRSYDARNRLLALRFPDGKGDQVRTWTKDGLPETITTYNGSNQTVPVVNAYHYNKRRMLDGQGESLEQPWN